MPPLSLRLKKFTGIRNGLGLEEVNVDLSKLSGLIALVGENGRGKTTFLDNLHHMRLMPSKCTPGKYTPGSCDMYLQVYDLAEKEFISEENGVKYRSLLTIDQVNRRQEAFFFMEKNGEWIPLNRSGKLSTFDAAVEAVVGSSDLFFNSVFRCQEALRLNSYRKGAIKDILADLLLLDSIKERGEKAKTIVKLLNDLIEKENEKKKMLDPQAASLTNDEKRLEEAKIDKQLIINELSDATAEEKKQRAEIEAADLIISRFAGVERTQKEKWQLLQDTAREKDQTCQRIQDLSDRHYGKYAAFVKKVARLKAIMTQGQIIREKAAVESSLTHEQEILLSRTNELSSTLELARKNAAEIERIRKEISALELKQARKVMEHKAKITAIREGHYWSSTKSETSGKSVLQRGRP